jgi:hypothetical protein
MAGELEVRQDLRFVNREDNIDGLQLYDYTVIHNDIEA